MLFAALALCLPNASAASPADGFPRLAAALAQERFVAYVPRSFSIEQGVPRPASREGIRDDLRRLRPHFSALITYGQGNGQEAIPELAVAAGFNALVLGVWDPTDQDELDRAIAAARRYPDQVIALVLGNEGLFWKRYSATDLVAAADYLRARLPGIALGSSEPFAVYFDSPDAQTLLALDLLLPNLHPRFEPWFDPAHTVQAAAFVVEVLDKLRARTDKPILVKETGLPSGPSAQGFTEQHQADFWTALLQRTQQGPTLNVALFEAFDAPWKPRELEDEFGRREPSEAYWGLFRADGSAKPVVARLGRAAMNPPAPD